VPAGTPQRYKGSAREILLATTQKDQAMTYTRIVFGSDRLVETRNAAWCRSGEWHNRRVNSSVDTRATIAARCAALGLDLDQAKTLADSEPFPSDEVYNLGLDPVGPDCDPAGPWSLIVKEI
jgi:hypothetical protein